MLKTIALCCICFRNMSIVVTLSSGRTLAEGGNSVAIQSNSFLSSLDFAVQALVLSYFYPFHLTFTVDTASVGRSMWVLLIRIVKSVKFSLFGVFMPEIARLIEFDVSIVVCLSLRIQLAHPGFDRSSVLRCSTGTGGPKYRNTFWTEIAPLYKAPVDYRASVVSPIFFWETFLRILTANSFSYLNSKPFLTSTH